MGHQLGLGIPDAPPTAGGRVEHARPLMVTIRQVTEQPALFAGMEVTRTVRRLRMPIDAVPAGLVDPYPDRGKAYNLLGRRPLNSDELAFHAESESIHAEWEDMRPEDAPNDCRPGMPKGIRPCPWVRCRHHLGIDPRGESIGLVHGHTEWERLEHTCSIDVALEGSARTEDVGRYMGVKFDRARQIERWAKRKVAKANARLRVLVDEGAEEGAGSPHVNPSKSTMGPRAR